jgi:hypothetical protein
MVFSHWVPYVTKFVSDLLKVDGILSLGTLCNKVCQCLAEG